MKRIGIILSAILALCQAELIRYELNVTSGMINPDCFTEGFDVPHINGIFPGPLLTAQVGDEVEILVRNQLKDFNTSIHYHGIRQIGSVDSDGVPGVTQQAIVPGSSYLQKFKITDQAGTYFYHAHVGLQDDSVQGSFIVYESDAANPKKVKENTPLKAGPYEYKKDITLQLSEWFHEELKSRQDYYFSDRFTFDRGSASILMNGHTVHDPSLEGVTEESCQGYTTFDVEPNTTYRLRLIGANSFRTLALGIKDHNMTMIEIDGELVHPYETSFLEITPGQRFSVLLKTGDHQPGTTFAIGTSYLWRQRGRGITENGFGYIRYVKPSEVKDENHTQLFKPIRKWTNKFNQAFNKRAEDGARNRKDGVLGAGDKSGVHNEKPDGIGAHVDDHLAGKNGTEHGGKNANNKPDGIGAHAGGKNGTETEHKGDKEEHKGDKEEHKGGRPEGGERGGGGRPDGDRADGPGGGRGGGGGGGGGSGGGGGRGGGGGGGGGRGRKPQKTYIDLPIFPKLDEPDWVWHKITPLAPRNPIVDKMDVRTIKLHTSYMKMPDNTTRYMVNKRLLPMSRAAPLVKNINQFSNASYTSDSERFNTNLNTYRLAHNEVVDLVFQNSVNAVGGCLLHPWHTHGHSHYVIASGPGDYVHEHDKDIRNFKNPLLKDTTVAYPSIPTKDTDGCGWTKVRLVADNPGFWAVHCHITTHMLQGKMVILEEAPELISRYSLYNRTTFQ